VAVLATLALLACGSLPPPPAAAAERVLYEGPAMFGRIFVSETDDRLRVLRFERYGARQSAARIGMPDHLELPYMKVVLSSLGLVPEPRRMLVVGVGGGTLPMTLHRYYPETRIDAVDIDPAVLDVARKFFGFRESAHLRAHAADGRKYIEQVTEPYELVYLDAFGASSIPEHLTTKEFLEAVRAAVAPGGAVVANLWGRGSNMLYDAMVRTYQEVFEHVYTLPVAGSGNVILIATPRGPAFDAEDYLARCRVAERARRFGFKACEPGQFGFGQARLRDEHERVLRDAPPAAR
jgi:spermidine synthase